MTGSVDILLDEHVGRVFERMLREYGHNVEQAKDRFGEQTVDAELFRWCDENEYLLVTNNAKDFEPLHRNGDHAGLLLFYDTDLPDEDPEGLARTVEEVLEQYGLDDLENELVDLGEWHDWLQE